MRVLVVIHYPVFGGPHNQALVLARALRGRGVETTVLLPQDSLEAVERFRAANVDVVTIPLHRLRATVNPLRHVPLLAFFWREISTIRRVIREREIDLVQVAGLVNPHSALAAKFEGVPIVWQLLDTRPPMALRRVMMPLVVRLADVVMTTGRGVANVHPGVERLGERLRVFFPPVEGAEFDPGVVDRTAARAEFGLALEDAVVGTVGNLNPQKGHEHLIEAVAIMRREQPRTRLLVVGASHDTHRAYERALHQLCERLGLIVGKDVVFAGVRSDVSTALGAMDVFALASVPRSEGAPTAIEEAMMFGLPVVATGVGSVAELVDHGRTGYIVAPLDPRALAHAALQLCDDAKLRARFGRRGRARALDLFSAQRCADVHVAAYELAGGRSRTTNALLADRYQGPAD
jgi:glycosyltransferase involved in cell wall biosynthesis